ncbi:MAG: hypothetical protein ABII00_03685 [Elusimicrobiota bacterium]
MRKLGVLFAMWVLMSASWGCARGPAEEAYDDTPQEEEQTADEYAAEEDEGAQEKDVAEEDLDRKD